ncbi:hypothetical protein HPB49_009704 [Dermacentor silvarum]|uniref:Uncharacterized protein n=1 Tax=Dermacentor silvarum TaxID=543639 RepID=A0ACB8CE91_DERSI|nr:hypothetical protein HPB49_009704 [Dermacentor silvarum]
MRCVLYKKKIEVCDTCLRTGHWKDACLTPNVKCHKCGLQDPLDGHKCKAKSAVCGGSHETHSNDCRRRFATPPIVRQRRQQSRQRRWSRSPGQSRSPSRTRASRSRERWENTTVDHPPPQQWRPESRSRSKSGTSRPISRARMPAHHTNQVSWASVVTHGREGENAHMRVLEQKN